MHFTAYTTGLALSAGFTFALAFVAWSRHPARGSRELAALLAAACVYATAATIEAAVLTVDEKVLWSALSYVGATTLPACSLIFILRIVDAGRWLRPRRIAALFIVPACSIAVAFCRPEWVWPQVSLVQTWAGTTALYAHGPWFRVHTVYSYAVLAAGLLVLAGSLRGLAGIYARQRMLLLFAMLVPFAGNIAYVLRPDLTTGQDLAPILFSVTGALLFVAMRRHRLLTLAPIARTALFEHTVDGVLFLTADGRINDINPAAMRMFGIGPPAIGEPLDAALRGEAAVLDALSPQRRRSAVAELVSDVRLQGPRWCDVRRVPLGRPGSPAVVGWLVTITDVTDRHVAADQRSRLARQQELALRFESLGVIANGVAHDFNNLLTTVMGHAELMLLDLQPHSPAAEAAREIAAAGRHGADLCARLQTYARSRPLERVALDVNACVRQGFEGIAGSGTTASVRFELDAGLPALWLDASALRQLVRVLGINAIEAARGRPHVVTVQTRRTELDPAALAAMPLAHHATPGAYVAIDVHDTGIGIAPEHAMRIFEPFFTTKFHGRGLGLPAALGIVQAHGGALQVTSASGEGTTVTVFLPVAAPARLAA